MIEEWEVFWRLAQRLDLKLDLPGLSVDREPTADDMIKALNPGARFPLEEIKQHPSGKVYGSEETEVGGVIPDMIIHADKRIAVGHPEAMAELREVRGEVVPVAGEYEGEGSFEFRAITYRMAEVYCTTGHNLPSLKKRRNYNPALMNATDMQRRDLCDGQVVTLDSGHGKVEAIVEASAEMAPGVIGLAHGWGDPLDERPVQEKGTNVQALIPRDSRFDPVTGLGQQSAYPVNVFTTERF